MDTVFAYYNPRPSILFKKKILDKTKQKQKQKWTTSASTSPKTGNAASTASNTQAA